MSRKLPEQKIGLNGLQYLDVLQVITNCEGCGADIELRTRLARDMFIPLSNDEMQHVMLIWLKNLPSKEQAERMFSIAEVLAEEYEKEEAERTT